MLVLDFDGTVTDAEAEGTPFRSGYLEDLALLCGKEIEVIAAMAERIENDVRRAPQEHGWRYDGHIVAPAMVDPYLRIMPVAREILDAHGIFPDEAARTRLLDGILYKYNYQKTNIAFRPGARELLRALLEVPGAIVTNSHTEPVRSKLRMLSGDSGELEPLVHRVYGSARKYVVNVGFDAVAEELAVPGLFRPILLRRQHYYEVLERLLQDAGQRWRELMVIGDIFELDLALPLALGAHVVLVVNQHTPDYERHYVASHARGTVVTELEQVTALIKQR